MLKSNKIKILKISNILTNGMQIFLSVFQVCLKTSLICLHKVFCTSTNSKVLVPTIKIQNISKA